MGVSTERSKTILVLKRNDGVIELEPVTSYVVMSDDDPEPSEEEKDFDVLEDGICNVLRDSDQQQDDFFDPVVKGDWSPTIVICNTVPMTLDPICPRCWSHHSRVQKMLRKISNS